MNGKTAISSYTQETIHLTRGCNLFGIFVCLVFCCCFVSVAFVVVLFVLFSRIASHCNDEFWVTWSNLEDAEVTLNL